MLVSQRVDQLIKGCLQNFWDVFTSDKNHDLCRSIGTTIWGPPFVVAVGRERNGQVLASLLHRRQQADGETTPSKARKYWKQIIIANPLQIHNFA